MAAPASAASRQASAICGRRDRQMRRLIRRGQVAGDGDGDEDAGKWLAHRGPHKDRPPSTTMVVPVENCRDVAQARMASATSSRVATRRSGVEAAILALKSAAAPGHEARVDHARSDAHDANFRREGARQRFGHHVDARLGRAIGDR